MVGALLSRASAASGVKGKQVRILCELVTVIEESVAKMSLGNWEGKVSDEAEPEELPKIKAIKNPAMDRNW